MQLLWSIEKNPTGENRLGLPPGNVQHVLRS